MKKVFFIAMLSLALTSLVSCESEITYSITNNAGEMGTAFVYECNDANEKIKTSSVTIANGETKSFIAEKATTKIKIYIEDLDRWVQQVFYLDLEKKHTEIVIDGKTIVGSKEP